MIAYTLVDGVARAPQELLAVDRPFANHNGGLLLFDPTGMLLVGIGDGGSAGDPDNRAQDLARPARQDPADRPADRCRAQPTTRSRGTRRCGRSGCATRGASPSTPTATSTSATSGRAGSRSSTSLPRAKQSGANYGWSVYEGELVFKKDGQVTGGGDSRRTGSDLPARRGRLLDHRRAWSTAGRRCRSSRAATCSATTASGHLWATDRTATGMTPLRELGVEGRGPAVVRHRPRGRAARAVRREDVPRRHA